MAYDWRVYLVAGVGLTLNIAITFIYTFLLGTTKLFLEFSLMVKYRLFFDCVRKTVDVHSVLWSVTIATTGSIARFTNFTTFFHRKCNGLDENSITYKRTSIFTSYHCKYYIEL